MNTPTRGYAFALLATASAVALTAAGSYATPARADAITTEEAANDVLAPLGGGTGIVSQLRIDPHGRVSGVILRDGGIELVVTGPNAQRLATFVQPGDRIRTPVGPNGTVEMENLGSHQVIQLGTTAAVARGGGPESQPSLEYPPVDDASQLGRVRLTGRVRSMLHRPHGETSGFVMEDGTQAYVLSRLGLAVTELVKPGDSIVVEGRGTRTPLGTGLWAVKVTRPGGQVLLDITRGVGAPELNLR